MKRPDRRSGRPREERCVACEIPSALEWRKQASAQIERAACRVSPELTGESARAQPSRRQKILFGSKRGESATPASWRAKAARLPCTSATRGLQSTAKAMVGDTGIEPVAFAY